MQRLLTPRWLVVHAAAVMTVIGFLLLGAWQVRRAASGNLLSYGYAVEWPVFAAFVCYVWISQLRRALLASRSATAEDGDPARTPPATPVRRSATGTGAAGRYDHDDEDPELAAYNRYLAWCCAHPQLPTAAYWDLGDGRGARQPG